MSKENDIYDVAVIGGGAAGLAASIFAVEMALKNDRPQRIALLDSAKAIGAKILVSGGGRCNVTHDVVTAGDYFGNRHIIKNVLAAFSVEQTVGWFASLGVDLKREETGKLFPVTDKARTILNALITRCLDLDVRILPDHRVTGIESSAESGFVLQHSHGTLHAKFVVMATGGRSIPKSGSDGFGFTLARHLGHSLTATAPALVPLVLADTMFHKTLSGLSHDVELTTVVEGHKIDCRTGSLLWTHFGISGPAVMDVSRFWTLAQETGQSADLYGNFLPGKTREQAKQWFIEQATDTPRRSLTKTLAQLVSERFAEALCLHIECDPQKAIAQLPRKDRDRLIEALLRFRFPVERDRGWNYAEVTAGGVPLDQINYRTMESKLVPGLYLIGEILDCDGRIGGFNFQWAWATGWLAGSAVATGVRPDSQTRR
ncbi:MAG: aminoacetone oxidase family FAD-binding enzyme [Nitrospira sp. CG24E]|nr:MAG: aminoacetone oxidase family FAD-binding enzyme [Nitrospira sp. CG24E]